MELPKWKAVVIILRIDAYSFPEVLVVCCEHGSFEFCVRAA